MWWLFLIYFVNTFLKNMQAEDLSQFIESLTKAIYINNIDYWI